MSKQLLVDEYVCRFDSFLEAQLLSNYRDVTPSLTGRLDLSVISMLVADRFGRFLLFCYLEFDKEAISDGFMVAQSHVFRGGGILSDFRELSFCGP